MVEELLKPLFTLVPPAIEPVAPAPEDDPTAAESPQVVAEGDWFCTVAPGGGHVGLAAGDVLDLFDCTKAQVAGRSRYRLPQVIRPGCIAVHPAGASIVAGVQGTFWAISRRPTDPSFAASVASNWGEPRAITFDPSGQVIWASFDGDDDKCVVCVLDLASGLALVGSVDCPGLPGAHHDIKIHPSGNVAAVTVEGTQSSRVNFLKLDGYTLSVIEREALPEEPFAVAGFSEDGEHLTAVLAQRVMRWQWTDREVASRIARLEDGHRFHQTGCYAGGNLVLLVETDDGMRLAILGKERLALQSAYRWEPGDQRELHGVVGLGTDRFLVIGDKRAGLFQL